MAKNISNRDALYLIQSGAMVIDIRDGKDFGVSHIPGALNISINDLDKLYLNKTQIIIVVCSHGIRSVAAAEMLTDLGYINVYNLKSGYDNYKTFASLK